MAWKFKGDRPVYLQVCEQFAAFILSGEIRPGQRLPGVRDLAAVIGVNTGTMQRALGELERDGIVQTHGTAGRTVTEDDRIICRIRQQRAEKAAEACVQTFVDLGLDEKTCLETVNAMWHKQIDDITETAVSENEKEDVHRDAE